MMIKKITSVALGVIVAVSFSGAFASQPTTVAKSQDSKMYVSLNGGYAKIKEKVAGSAKNDTKGYTYGVDAGMNVAKNVAVEAGYTKLPNEKFDTVTGNKNYIIDVVAKGTMPLADNYNAFGKVGVARVHHKVTGATNVADAAGTYTVYTPMAAVGVADKVSASTDLTAQVAATAKRHEAPANLMASVGLVFNF